METEKLIILSDSISFGIVFLIIAILITGVIVLLLTDSKDKKNMTTAKSNNINLKKCAQLSSQSGQVDVARRMKLTNLNK